MPSPVGRRKATSVSRFDAEAAYADSIFRQALGDSAGCVAALERALEFDPTYAPAVLSLGSVEYQRGREAAGRELFRSLLALPAETPDLSEIIDEAGSFLIERQAYAEALELFRAAAQRFPRVAALHSGYGCCAGHQGLHDDAILAATRALELEPDRSEFVSDLGWILCEAGRLNEAEEILARAVGMDPGNELAAENLRICRERASRAKIVE